MRISSILIGQRKSAETRVQVINLNHVRPSCLFKWPAIGPRQTFTQHAIVPPSLSVEGKLLLYSHCLSETAQRSKRYSASLGAL